MAPLKDAIRVENINLTAWCPRMTGLHHLSLGYGCMDPQQMENLAVEAFSKMHHLVHFSLKKLVFLSILS